MCQIGQYSKVVKVQLEHVMPFDSDILNLIEVPVIFLNFTGNFFPTELCTELNPITVSCVTNLIKLV